LHRKWLYGDAIWADIIAGIRPQFKPSSGDRSPMPHRPPFLVCLATLTTLLIALPSRGGAQPSAPMATQSGAAVFPAAHDGAHDFDWMFGTWKATLHRLVKPLTGSTTWVDLEGRQTSRPVWGGKANLDEFIVDNPAAGVKIEGVTLRLYDPTSQQWRIYWANSKRGVIDTPVMGRFSNGRGEFYGMDDLDGRSILVRYVWSNITPNSAHFEQSFSPDGGKTWETNWISDVTRIASTG